MRTKNRDIVGAVLISIDKEILFGDALPTGVYPDCLHIPGGGVEEGETKEEALIREVKEETGIDISSYPIKLLDDSKIDAREKTDKSTGERYMVNMHFFDYEVSIPLPASQINFCSGDDLLNCRWISISDLKNNKLSPPSLKLFKSLNWID